MSANARARGSSRDEAEADMIRHLTASREHLVRFVRSRVRDQDRAEDIVQDSLLKALKAMRADAAPLDDERMTAWVFRIVRNAIADSYRAEGRRARREAGTPVEPTTVTPDLTAVCQCFEALLPTLKPEYAEVIRALELEEQSTETVARRLGVTRANLKVRRHRARQQLKQRLEETCRTCASHGCLDCSCRPGTGSIGV